MGGGLSTSLYYTDHGSSCKSNESDKFYDGTSIKNLPLPTLAISPAMNSALRRYGAAMSPTARIGSKLVPEIVASSAEEPPKEKASTMHEVRERLPKRSSIARSSFLNENSIRTLVQEFSNRPLETSYIPPSTAFVATTNPHKLKKGSFAVVPQASTTLSFIYSPTDGPHHEGTVRSLSPAFDALYGQFLVAENGSSFSQSTDHENNSVSKMVYSPGSNSRKPSFLSSDQEANSSSRLGATRKQSFPITSVGGSGKFSGSGNSRAFKSALGLKIELFSPPDQDSPSVRPIDGSDEFVIIAPAAGRPRRKPAKLWG